MNHFLSRFSRDRESRQCLVTNNRTWNHLIQGLHCFKPNERLEFWLWSLAALLSGTVAHCGTCTVCNCEGCTHGHCVSVFSTVLRRNPKEICLVTRNGDADQLKLWGLVAFDHNMLWTDLVKMVFKKCLTLDVPKHESRLELQLWGLGGFDQSVSLRFTISNNQSVSLTKNP